MQGGMPCQQSTHVTPCHCAQRTTASNPAAGVSCLVVFAPMKLSPHPLPCPRPVPALQQLDASIGCVVLGWDPSFDFTRLQYAAMCLRELPGCFLVATNLDDRWAAVSGTQDRLQVCCNTTSEHARVHVSMQEQATLTGPYVPLPVCFCGMRCSWFRDLIGPRRIMVGTGALVAALEAGSGTTAVSGAVWSSVGVTNSAWCTLLLLSPLTCCWHCCCCPAAGECGQGRALAVPLPAVTLWAGSGGDLHHWGPT